MTYRRNFLINFKELKNSIAKERNRTAGEYWLRVNQIIISSNFSSIKTANEISQLYLEGYSDESIGIKLNIKENTVRLVRKNISDELYNLFGEDFFDLYSNFNTNKDILEKRIYLAEHLSKGSKYIISDEIPLDILTILKQKTLGVSSIEFNINDCSKELSFLKRYSKSNIEDDVNHLNIEKLNFLLEIIEGTMGTMEEKYEIFKAMEGGK